jgi:cation diffusion facilitator CzcD-associated flavoprotein CzcO
MDENVRIAIIGGGPAGLSAGMYLEQAGFDNYTIFERNGWVGGKCHSPNYKGRRYEMGAIMGGLPTMPCMTWSSSAAPPTKAARS